MFAALMDFLEQQLGDKPTAGRPSSQDTRRAVAALCVEMARADTEEHPGELERAQAVLAQRFALSPEEAAALLKEGMTEDDRAASLYRFVTLINQQFDDAGKRDLMEMLWRVALADGRLDKYEDALMHKLADLMYVPLTELMYAKQKALAGKSGE